MTLPERLLKVTTSLETARQNLAKAQQAVQQSADNLKMFTGQKILLEDIIKEENAEREADQNTDGPVTPDAAPSGDAGSV